MRAYHYVKVQKRRINDSYHHYITIPASIARELGIDRGDIVELSVETMGGEKVVVVRVALRGRVGEGQGSSGG